MFEPVLWVHALYLQAQLAHHPWLGLAMEGSDTNGLPLSIRGCLGIVVPFADNLVQNPNHVARPPFCQKPD
jgi:hypothetical protein